MKPRLVVLVLCLGLVGCFGPRTRFQSPEEGEAREAEVRTIGDVTDVAAQDEIPAVGVGLVVGLTNKTGGGAPPASTFREHLENDLKKKGVRNVRATLEDPSCTMVIVQARIGTSARKNDAIDLDISLPEMSRCTSLKGGYLIACELFNYENSRNISTRVPEQTLRGYPLVKAEGPVICGVTGRVRVVDEQKEKPGDAYRNEDESLRSGRVWGGGKLQIDPPIMLVLRQNQQLSRVAASVADRINAAFPGMKYGRDGLASAKNKQLVMIGVPQQYRYDVAHYLRVVRAIPLDRMPGPDSPYRKKLAEQLLDPVNCLGAAIRLEALGEESVPLLRPALNAPLPLSRFAAARALTYLRKRDGVEELARLARQNPALRGQCLTALASLDESICHTRLAELMSDPDPELRYGAFCGLRRLDERAPEIAPEKCRDAFIIHQIAPDSEPLVHYLTSRRTEITVFGRAPQLLPGLHIAVGDELTVSTGDDGQVTIKRFCLKDKSVSQKQCAPAVTDVLHLLAELGGSYSDAVDLLTKAHANKKMNCELYHDALPRLVEPAQLAKVARNDPTLNSAIVK